MNMKHSPGQKNIGILFFFLFISILIMHMPNSAIVTQTRWWDLLSAPIHVAGSSSKKMPTHSVKMFLGKFSMKFCLERSFRVTQLPKMYCFEHCPPSLTHTQNCSLEACQNLGVCLEHAVLWLSHLALWHSMITFRGRTFLKAFSSGQSVQDWGGTKAATQYKECKLLWKAPTAGRQNLDLNLNSSWIHIYYVV